MQKIIIKARKKAFSLFSGHRYSTKHGEGLDFSELREYQIGDNVKRIDYNVTAKKQKPYIKVFNEEKELNIVIVGLIDYKTYFGTNVLKYEKILETISTLAFSALNSGDRVGIEIYSKQNIFIKPTKNRKSIMLLSSFDENIIDIKIDYKKILDSLIRHKKNTVLIIVSDFFIEYDFKKLGSKFDTYAVIVRDKLEEDPSKLNGLTIVNPINNKTAIADFDNSYKAQILGNDTKLITNFKKSNIKYMKLYTNDDITKLRRLFG